MAAITGAVGRSGRMELREIKGFISDGYAIKSAEVIVRFTSDETGERILLQTDDIMIGVPFEKVKKMIEKARRKR